MHNSTSHSKKKYIYSIVGIIQFCRQSKTAYDPNNKKMIDVMFGGLTCGLSLEASKRSSCAPASPACVAGYVM